MPRARIVLAASAATVLAGAALAAVAVTAVAHDAPEPDVRAIAGAKVSLAQAVTLAEQHAGGKATRAEFESTRQGWAYDVEVVAGTQVLDVRVDAAAGTVLSMQDDPVDHDDEHDEKD